MRARVPELVGRRHELRAVGRQLAPRRVVTLTGPGGAGKTTLARAAVAQANVPFVWVELADVADVEALLVRLHEALVIPSGAGASRANLARALVRRGPTLVVLDSAERARGEVARLLRDLRETCVEAQWLCTSRARLELPWEHVVTLGPLSASDARALWSTRAKPGTPASGRAIDALLRAVERMPLGVELAAAWTHDLGVAEVHRAVREGALTCEGGGRTSRHASLDASAAWSLALLSDADRDALVRLSVVHGELDAGEAASLLEVPRAEVTRCFRDWVLHSLARRGRDGGVRFYDSVREHARRRADPQAQARWHAVLLSRADTHARAIHEGDPVPALAWLRAHGEDLLAAMSTPLDAPSLRALASGLDGWLLSTGPVEVHAAVLHRLHAALVAHQSAHAELAFVCALQARAAYLRGLHDDARRAIAWAHSALTRDADDATQSEVLLIEAAVRRAQGDLQAALAAARQATRHAPRPALALRARLQEANTLAVIDRAASRTAFVALRAEARTLGVRRVVALSTANLALLAELDGALELASSLGDQALRELAVLSEHRVLARVQISAARTALLRGQRAEATRRLSRAARMVSDLDDHAGQVEITIVRAMLARARGDATAAQFHLDDALAGARALGSAELERSVDALRDARDGVETLLVADSAFWFEYRGARVDLSRRTHLRRLLEALVTSRALEPGRALTVEALVAAGWPGERIVPDAARERVYTALRTLRRLGLEGVLVRRDGGYALDPSVPLVAAEVSR